LSYRPITDVWILVRSKVKYYGAFAGGFLERARSLLGVHMTDPILHVCGGRVKDYPYPERAIGPHDATIDLDPNVNPDYLMDVRRLGVAPGDLFPLGRDGQTKREVIEVQQGLVLPEDSLWAGAIIDRPYTPEDATHYAPPVEVFPASINELLKRTLSVVKPGGRVGVLDYIVPQPPAEGVKFVALAAVVTGYNNRIRAFTVFERVWKPAPTITTEDEGDEDELGEGEVDGADEDAAELMEAAAELGLPIAELPEPPLVAPTPIEVAVVGRAAESVEARASAPQGPAADPTPKGPPVCRPCWNATEHYPEVGADVVPIRVRCVLCNTLTQCVSAPACVACAEPALPGPGLGVGPRCRDCVNGPEEASGADSLAVAMDGF
jgi:hypothetical protein